MRVVVSGLASRGDVILGAGAGVFTWPLTLMRGVRVARFQGWAACGFEEVQPLLVVVPAFGQVQGEVAAAVAGGAGRDVDEVAAYGGAAGPGVGAAGESASGAQQV